MRYHRAVCRSIKPLRGLESGPSEAEIEAAARQFVRKVSGYHRPAQRNVDVFEAAVDEVSIATRRLLAGLINVPPRRRPVPSDAPGP